MKFDFVIGNPPYQEETAQKDTANGQKTQKNIFHYFQIQADQIATKGSVMIYPAGRWIHQSGKGLRTFGSEQINDPHLKKLVFYKNSNSIFPQAAIADGVSIVLKDMTKKTAGFDYVYTTDTETTEIHADNPGEDLMPLNPNDHTILKKIDEFVKREHIAYMHDGILPRTFFGIESNFAEENPDKVRPYDTDMDVDFSHEVKLFTNDKAGKAGRAKWFVADKGVITNNPDKIGEWQVVVSSANAGGQKRDNQLEIMDNHSAFGRARVALKSFRNCREAENFYAYMKTYVIRYAFLMTDEALTSLGKRVPDLLDYSDGSKGFDFGHDLDGQLFKKIGLREEVDYIKGIVDNLR